MLFKPAAGKPYTEPRGPGSPRSKDTLKPLPTLPLGRGAPGAHSLKLLLRHQHGPCLQHLGSEPQKPTFPSPSGPKEPAQIFHVRLLSTPSPR